MGISDRFHELLTGHEDDPQRQREAADLVRKAPEGGERDGLMALMYHEGIGVKKDLDRSFEYAERAAFEGKNGLGYFLLGYMCDNAETPDQAEGGPRQKYDHYDAERFYELCGNIDSRWRDHAILWLGDHYMDTARGGDPEIGVEYYEKIADHNAEAAGRLSDYYWDLVVPDHRDDEDWVPQLYRWTVVAERLDPENYAVQLGWLYADGIGCEKSIEKGVAFFKKAYVYDDWRGADSIASLYEEMLAGDPDMSDRKRLEEEIVLWRDRADRLHAEQLLNDPGEADPSQEED